MTEIDFNQPDLSPDQARHLLTGGVVEELYGLLPWSTNRTFLVQVSDGDLKALAIYKPQRGERPLWDFPDGTLALREVAAYVVSQALGWQIVPPTVFREDDVYGPGMLQLFIPHDPDHNYFAFGPEARSQLARIALFDHVINNADRKGGHCLVDEHGHIWAIDHGICFHTQPKLRTVIWDFAGQPIRQPLLDDLVQLHSQIEDLSKQLTGLLASREIDALCVRVGYLIRTRRYPEPGEGRNYPWPPV